MCFQDLMTFTSNIHYDQCVSGFQEIDPPRVFARQQGIAELVVADLPILACVEVPHDLQHILPGTAPPVGPVGRRPLPSHIPPSFNFDNTKMLQNPLTTNLKCCIPMCQMKFWARFSLHLPSGMAHS